MKLSITEKGFSLIEVVVSLFILSISVITIYNLIISTAISSHDLEQRYLAKEVANNRISLIHTLEKSLKPIQRSGEMIMGGQQWRWDETINNGPSDEFFEYEISVRLENEETYIYTIKGLYTK
ncbi:type II secretion system minor pseudopilin GspI [Gammaproteobacteria bacterium]|jgi:type II secretion system protein I|nr:type II secretion system minor pseudopilin GspI [Gammaproteobacteria bacterium]|tara:strand:+ start:1040 stop:1408 length:369 start_codon:yes stop_codon:yes gene_type:complete